MNDRIGTLVKFHTEPGRWQVNVDGENLLLKASNLCITCGGPAAGADAEVPLEAASECMSVESGPTWEVPGQAIHPGLAVRVPGMVSNLCEASEGPRADADVDGLGDAAAELSEGLCVGLSGVEERGLYGVIGRLV